MAQTYGDFEAIVVDDCATDGSGRIAESIAAGDDRIRVIHQPENMGVSVARNTGMQEASGEYILFWDPDDRYEHRLLEIVHDSLMLANGDRSIAKKADPNIPDVDILYYSLVEDYYDVAGNIKSSYEKTCPTGEYYTHEDISKKVNELEQKTMLGYPWNKAYRLSYLRENDVSFERVTHVEDILFNIAAVEQARHIVVLQDVLYHYRNMGQSRLTGKYLADYLELQKLRITRFLELYERWDAMDDSVLSNMAGMYFRSLFSAVEREIAAGKDRASIEEMLAAEYEGKLYSRLKDHLKGGKSVRLLYKPLVDKNSDAAIGRARLVSFVKKHFPILFAGLKQNR